MSPWLGMMKFELKSQVIDGSSQNFYTVARLDVTSTNMPLPQCGFAGGRRAVPLGSIRAE
jgi:hypothetical protein